MSETKKAPEDVKMAEPEPEMEKKAEKKKQERES